jgi:hypothetical protein
MDMVTFTRMTTAVQNEMREKLDALASVDDPEVRENWLLWGKKLIELSRLSPDPQQEAQQVRLHEARANLRALFEERGLPLDARLGSRIDACEDLATLHRWLRAVVTATSAAEALR